MARLQDVILRGTRAAQPAANTKAPGTIYYVTDESETERVNDAGSAWESISDAGTGVTAHSALTGLTAGDDHTQYRLESADHSHQSTGLQGGQIDHGAAVTGLADDDHTQYALLAGRATGQVLTGGTASGDDLTLRSTSDATKGDILLADQGGNIIIGGGTTASRLRILEASGSGTNYTEFVVQAQAGNITYTLPPDDGDAGEQLTTDGSGNLTWDAAGSGGGGGTGGFPLLLRPMANEPPSSAFATLDLRNGHPVLDFDGSTDEEAVWTTQLPDAYAGGGLTISTYWAFTSATTGSLRVQAATERMDLSSLDIDADSFASFQSAGGTAPGTSGHIIKVDVALTDGAQMDSIAAGELFRVKIRRDADGTSGTDDITTDAELVMVIVNET